MATLTADINSLPTAPEYYSESGFWQWTKVIKKEENIFQIIQYPVGCKDYVVDTYFRFPGSMRNIWTEEEIYQNYVALYLPNNRVKDLFLSNIEKLLHPWEKKHCLKPVVVHPVETSWNKKISLSLQYVIEFDPKIMRNATAFSFYLSLIRSLGYNKTETLGFKDAYGCNEEAYYQLCKYKNILDGIIEVPKFLWKKTPEGYNNIGTEVSYNWKAIYGHGSTGIFNLLNNISYYINNNPTEVKHLQTNYLVQLILNRMKRAGYKGRLLDNDSST